MSDASQDALAARIEALAAPIAADHGAELYDVEVGRNGRDGTVRIFVERAADSVAEQGGITIGEVTKIAKEIGYVLDAEDVVPFASYKFEVSSPGVERPLRTRRNVARNVGEVVRLVLSHETSDGRRVVEGTLSAFADDTLVVTSDDGAETRVPFDDVRRGNTVFDFEKNPPKK